MEQAKTLKQEIWEKSKKHKEWSMVLTDYISRPVAYLIARFTNLTPNQISILSFILGLAGCYFLIRGGYQNTLIGASLAMAYNVLDMTDGIIARVKGKASRVGHWLDGILGFVLTPLLVISLAIGLRNYLALTLGLFAAISYPLQYNLVYFFNAEVVNKNEKLGIPGKGKLEWTRYVYGISLFYIALFVAAIADKTFWVLGFWAVFGNLYWMAIVMVQFLTIRKQQQ
ncbi:hypothetical protein COV20_03865 [Candidatus Woesearchaeota archaeon CG10_big_fil_rev_8_21_14_0_10_45_16]|nr:MAG: hypothetical protein COV20_03865 [Candidatus Woesearchaeota archaeon CG10_big_fil_rev_8_21_14_0_10_45_16]